MHEILNLFKQQPISKFQQKLINFEKSQNFSKTPKPRFQNMKYMKIRENKLTKWREKLEKAWKTFGKRFGVRESVLEGERMDLSRERSRKMRRKLRWTFM